MKPDTKTRKAIERYRHFVPKPRQYRIPSGSLKFIAAAINASSEALMVVFELEETTERFLCDMKQWGNPKSFNLAKCQADSTHWVNRPLQGSHWMDYFGETYRVVANVHHVATGEHYVVYKADEDGVTRAIEASVWGQSNRHAGLAKPTTLPIDQVR
jgi:hypothetical protein